VTDEDGASRRDRRRGIAAGVPYVAEPPPEGTERPALVAVLHELDEPSTAERMANTLPLEDVPAWRVYLGLPMTGDRQASGGPEEMTRRATEDPLMKVAAPVIEQAARELPEAIEAIRKELGLPDDAKVGLVGVSAGAAAILGALARSGVKVDAVALINPVARARSAIEAGERAFGTTYGWTDERRAKADELDFVRRAQEIVSGNGQPPILILQGEDDDQAFVRGSEDLREKLAKLYRTPSDVVLRMVRNLGHPLWATPEIEKGPSNEAATYVDHEVRGMLARHLV
jgi:predicted esterase